tara:strand:- start:358 stop:642 length:285 start_codon:yes stop_codon:yes gene_type:complete
MTKLNKNTKTTELSNKQPLVIDGVSGSFSWTTDYYHNDNAFTMTDFLENHLTDEFTITFEDGSYAEIKMGVIEYALDSKGKGDSYNHIVEWNLL